MSPVGDFVPDTLSIARVYCPGCEPGADPEAEILDVRWCERHGPKDGGADDARVESDAVPLGVAEAGGASNKAWCDLLHRRHQHGRHRPARTGDDAGAISD